MNMEEIEISGNGEYDAEEEYEELEVSEAIQEISDELSVHSELLEQLVQVQQEKLEQDKQFQERLIAVLEKLANK